MNATMDIDRKKALIKKQPIFAQLTDDECDLLAELFTEKMFNSGDTIVSEGEPVDSVFLIISGEAEVRHIRIIDHNPEVTSLAMLGPSSAIGLNETGFFSLSGVRTATVVAKTEVLTLRLSVAAFNGFSLTHSHVSEIMHANANKNFDS